MRELLTVLCGQAGLQIGDVCWDQFCREHRIGSDGQPLEEQKTANGDDVENYRETLFYRSGRGYTPRAILVDTDPSVIGQMIRAGGRYSPSAVVSGSEDAANNFARGYYNSGPKILSETLDIIRKTVELCDNFQGFLLVSSFGGGTGSGCTARLVSELDQQYYRLPRLEFNVFPSSHLSTAVVEPYNAVFRAHTSLSYPQCMFLFDNETCYELCRRHLDVERAHYYHINQLIAQVMSSVTGSCRFPGELNIDLTEFQTNLVPFSRIHFVAPSFAPLVPRTIANRYNISVDQLTKLCFQSDHQMFQLDPATGKYITCCLMYRGDVCPKDVNAAMVKMKSMQQLHFPEWCTTGFKCGITGFPPGFTDIAERDNGEIAAVPRSACLLVNNTSLGNRWDQLTRNFRLMYAKRAFVHWYTAEGMEEGEFAEALEDIQQLVYDYKELALDDFDL